MKSLEDKELQPGKIRILRQSKTVLFFKIAFAFFITLIIVFGIELLRGVLAPGVGLDTNTILEIIDTTLRWVRNLFIIFFCGLVLYLIARWWFDLYIVEPQHIIVRRGIISTTEDRSNMMATEELEVKQGALGKIFNYGTISLYNPEQEHAFNLFNISDPYDVAMFIKNTVPSLEIIHGLSPSRPKKA